MKINCNIDGQSFSLVASTDKPLNQILQETVPSFAVKNKCLNANCGNCVVIMDGTCVLSCLVPAFKLNGTKIETFEGFSKTKSYHDIEKAFEETGISPCKQCYASKVLLIDSILQKMDTKIDATKEMIKKEIAINNCQCVNINELEKVIYAAYAYRRKRNARR